MSVLIWVQNVRHSDSVPERIFQKLILKKVSRRQHEHEKLPSMQRVKYSLTVSAKTLEEIPCLF